MLMAGRVHFGPGVSAKAGELAKGAGAGSALIVTDENMERLGMAERISESLKKAGVDVTVFSGVEPEPSVETTDSAAAIARERKVKAVIGLGGGSSMDVAKAVSVLVTNEGSAAKYQGLGLVRNPGVMKIMIPTTAGTGSEVTFTAVLIRKSDGVKGGINSDYLYPEISLLDPELTVSMPAHVTASTGMDALAHALEAYTSLKASPFSDMFAEGALTRIGRWLRVAAFNGRNIEARGEMMLAALFGGVALANAGVTACHALAYPLGGMFGVPHGVANALLIPHVARWNAPASPERFADAASLLGYPQEEGEPDHVAAQFCAEALDDLVGDLGLPATLGDLDVGITEGHLEEMAAKAMGVARPMENNPRVMTKDDCVTIYREAME